MYPLQLVYGIGNKIGGRQEIGGLQLKGSLQLQRIRKKPDFDKNRVFLSILTQEKIFRLS